MAVGKAVIFDWGGVLMRTHDYSWRRAWDSRLERPEGSVESVVHGIEAWEQAQLGEIAVEEYWGCVQAELSLTDAQLQRLRADFYRGDQLDLDMARLLRELKASGVKIALLSNNTPDLRAQIGDLGLAEVFDSIMISSEIGVMKPDPQAYRRALAELDVAPSRAAFIDDSILNVDAARTLGLYPILFTSSLDVRAALFRWLRGDC